MLACAQGQVPAKRHTAATAYLQRPHRVADLAATISSVACSALQAAVLWHQHQQRRQPAGDAAAWWHYCHPGKTAELQVQHPAVEEGCAGHAGGEILQAGCSCSACCALQMLARLLGAPSKRFFMTPAPASMPASCALSRHSPSACTGAADPPQQRAGDGRGPPQQLLPGAGRDPQDS